MLVITTTGAFYGDMDAQDHSDIRKDVAREVELVAKKSPPKT
jgi:hypothetical protein